MYSRHPERIVGSPEYKVWTIIQVIINYVENHVTLVFRMYDISETTVDNNFFKINYLL